MISNTHKRSPNDCLGANSLVPSHFVLDLPFLLDEPVLLLLGDGMLRGDSIKVRGNNQNGLLASAIRETREDAARQMMKSSSMSIRRSYTWSDSVRIHE